MLEMTKHLLRLSAIPALAVVLAATTRPGDASQDMNYRVMSLERKVDQFQSRLDMVERTAQNQSMTSRVDVAQSAMAATLDLQRQQNSLAEQIIILQKQMLELQKQIDRLPSPEKKEPPKEEAKPKPRAAKP